MENSLEGGVKKMVQEKEEVTFDNTPVFNEKFVRGSIVVTVMRNVGTRNQGEQSTPYDTLKVKDSTGSVIKLDSEILTSIQKASSIKVS